MNSQQLQQVLSNEIARQMKNGWEVIGVGPLGAVMGRSKAKHNGILGGILLAPFSLGLSFLWTLARNFDQKAEGLSILVDPETGAVTSQLVDYEQMMAQLAVQQANLEN